MLIRRLVKSDYGTISGWVDQKGLSNWRDGVLPSPCYLVLDGDTAVAVGGLRTIDGNSGLVDPLAFNPEASTETKHTALTQLIGLMQSFCGSLSLTDLYFLSGDQVFTDYAKSESNFAELSAVKLLRKVL